MGFSGSEIGPAGMSCRIEEIRTELGANSWGDLQGTGLATHCVDLGEGSAVHWSFPAVEVGWGLGPDPQWAGPTAQRSEELGAGPGIPY